MQEIIIDRSMRDAVAVDFARSIRLIDVTQHSHLMNEFNDFKKEEDPSGGNRTGSSK